jgi:hypothetical protein
MTGNWLGSHSESGSHLPEPDRNDRRGPEWLDRPIRSTRAVDRRRLWIQGAVATGVPAEYGKMLRMLTETVASGKGSRPNDNVENVTGAHPIRFFEFARRTGQAWT